MSSADKLLAMVCMTLLSRSFFLYAFIIAMNEPVSQPMIEGMASPLPERWWQVVHWLERYSPSSLSPVACPGRAFAKVATAIETTERASRRHLLLKRCCVSGAKVCFPTLFFVCSLVAIICERNGAPRQ